MRCGLLGIVMLALNGMLRISAPSAAALFAVLISLNFSAWDWVGIGGISLAILRGGEFESLLASVDKLESFFQPLVHFSTVMGRSIDLSAALGKRIVFHWCSQGGMIISQPLPSIAK